MFSFLYKAIMLQSVKRCIRIDRLRLYSNLIWVSTGPSRLDLGGVPYLHVLVLMDSLKSASKTDSVYIYLADSFWTCTLSRSLVTVSYIGVLALLESSRDRSCCMVVTFQSLSLSPIQHRAGWKLSVDIYTCAQHLFGIIRTFLIHMISASP